MYRLKEGIAKIYEADLESQKHYIETIGKLRYIDFDFIKSIGGFFVPNNDYMHTHFGSIVLEGGMDLYNFDGLCKWHDHLVFPITDSLGQIVGLVGYNPLSKLMKQSNEENGTSYEIPHKYSHSSKYVFTRGRYLFIPLGYDKMLNSDYLILTDGVFDAISFSSLGFVSASALGSNLTKEIMFILSFVKNLYVAHDNDNAGMDFYKKIQKHFPNAKSIRQDKYKDIDEYIKNTDRTRFIDFMNKSLNNQFKSSIYINL